jgi:uncharacterized membrane protein
MDPLTPPGSPAPFSSGGGPAPGAAPAREPRVTTLGDGRAWWTQGWRWFAAAPGVWVAITLLFVVISVLLSFIPVLGGIAGTLLAPVFAGGILAGFRTIDRGGTVTTNQLFAGFNDRLVPLVVVGLLYLAGTFAIVLVVAAIVFMTVGWAGIGALMTGDPLQAGIAILATLGVGAMAAVLVGLVLGVPLMMAYWFAPALVVFRNDEPFAAMKTSFTASLVNTVPLLIYSLLGLLWAVLATLPLCLGWLVLAPVFAGSVYASYKDIFGEA